MAANESAGPEQPATTTAPAAETAAATASEIARPAGTFERSLQGVQAIRLDGEQLDLVVESDAGLSGVVRLTGATGEHAPELRQDGADLVLYQRGRHQTPPGTTLVLRLPEQRCPPIQGQLQAGQTEFRRVNADITIGKGSGGARVEGGAGAFNLHSGSGHVSVADRDGPIRHNSGSGGVDFTRCTGPIHVNQGSGGARLIECENEAAVNTGSGGITLDRPKAQDANLNTGSGGIHIHGGSLIGLKANTGSGGVESTAQLTIWERRDTALFSAEAGSGKISFDLPPDVPVRVEVVVKEGEVVSDVPLVGVGLPGQRGAARRYVGVANVPTTGGPPSRRIDLRLKTEKGDVDLRLPGASSAAGAARQRIGPGRADQQRAERDEEVRAILDALERREITVAQAEALLEGMKP